MKKIGWMMAACLMAGMLAACKTAGTDGTGGAQEITAETEETEEKGTEGTAGTKETTGTEGTTGTEENADEAGISADDAADTGTTVEAGGEAAADGAETENEDIGLKNFDVADSDAKAFAQQIQKAVADKDMEALADLMVFPNYVSIYDKNDGLVKTREDFIAIGADKIFTEAFVASIANADLDDLGASMAGFTLYSKDDSTAPGLTFSMTESNELKITGINY